MHSLLLILILFFLNLSAQDKKEVYKVAFLKDWKPYYYMKSDGSLDGYAYELFENISKKTDLRFEYKVVDTWKDVFSLAEKKEIDIIPNLGITKDRESLFLFTQSTDTFRIKLFKRENSINIKKLEDLKEKELGVMITNVCNRLITSDITNKKIVFDNFPELITSLSSGESDVVCYPESLFNAKLEELGLSKMIVNFEKTLKEVKRGIAITKENFDILDILNHAISDIKIDGTYQKIYSKWFGKKEKSKITKNTFDKLLIVLLLLIFVLLFVLFWNNKLKNEREKQKKLERKLEDAQNIAKVGHYTYNFIDQSFICSSQIDKLFALEKNDKKDLELWLDCIHSDDRKRVILDWENSIENNTEFSSEYRIINPKTKKVIWVIGLGKIIRDENSNPISMFGTVQDINDRKSLEQKLSQAMMVFENTHDGIIITDKNTNIINVNKSFEKTTGYKLEEVINKKPNILRADINDDDFYKNMWHDLNTKGVWSGEIVNKRKGNENYYEILTINAIYDSSKEVSGYIGIFSDITKQKSDEKMLLVQSKVAAVGEMLGNISHQWRQPLSVISIQATGLKVAIEFEEGDISNERIIDAMDKINEQTQYLSKTIDDFRNFFKGDTHEITNFNLKDAFVSLEQLTKDALKDNYIKYQSDIIDLELTKNQNLFIQAMINIFNNAKDAMVENIKNTDDRFLFIDTYIEDNNLIISIKDTGGGIPINIVENIFDPYFTTKHQSVGTGIGLYMTHQIITKRFKGSIITNNTQTEINGKLLRGAEFMIKIPFS